MGRKRKSESPERPHRLSLTELAAHDDACSDALIDKAFFKSQIRKNRNKYNPMRGIGDEEVPKILLQKVIVDKDPTAAEKALLQLPGLKRYKNALHGKLERENFLSHLRKYIHMYMTDCPWEVSSTNRYTIVTYEAAVTSRQRIKQGQTIKYLTGTMVPLTQEESADLDHTNRNFSIVVSARKKYSSIFLGPARFANHDCNANGRLVTKGNDAMEVIAVKNIEVGDEITVSYGDDYFGPNNQDCLCHTCERLVQNGWLGARSITGSPRSSIMSEERASPGHSNKRKRDSSAPGSDMSPSKSAKMQKLKQSPSKLQQSWTPPSSVEEISERTLTAVQDEGDLSPSQSKLSPPFSPHNIDIGENRLFDGEDNSRQNPPSSKDSTTNGHIKLNKMTARLLGNLPVIKTYPPSPNSIAPPSETESNIAEVTIKIESIETSKIETDAVPGTVSSMSDTLTAPQASSVLTTTEVTKSILPSIEVDGVASATNTDHPAISTSVTTSTLQIRPIPPPDRSVRVPGDYLLTRRLLAQPHDRWVQCNNTSGLCHTFFLQPNGYQTRRECPRCERHSMLYGFSWPKTDPDLRKLLEAGRNLPGTKSGPGRKKKNAQGRSAYRRAGRCGKGNWVEGGGDEEERVLDHRTVHRFVLPEDEKTVARRGLLKMAELARLRGEEVDWTDGNYATRDTGSAGLESDGPGARGSETPDEWGRRRSNRFVTRVGVYADV